MQSLSRIVGLCALLCLAWAAPLAAGENEGIATVVRIVPKPGHEETLVRSITDYHHWMAHFEGHMEYTWYEVLTGPDTGAYIARSGNHNWADFDAEYDWQKEADEVFARNVAPNIDHAQRMMTSNLDDVSHWPESFDGYTHYQLEQWQVNNGQYGKFMRGLKKIVDALKANGSKDHWGFISVVSGGNSNQIELITPLKGWAGMSEEEPTFLDIMTRVLGGADAMDAFMMDWGSTFQIGQKFTIRYLPEASDYGSQ